MLAKAAEKNSTNIGSPDSEKRKEYPCVGQWDVLLMLRSRLKQIMQF